MARVDVSVSSELEPETAWKLASDLDRFGEWMTIFAGWRGPVPDTIGEGTRVASCVKVKGFRNVIHWTVTRYDQPKSIELQGRGRGGIRLTVAMTVTDDHPGSVFHLTAVDVGGDVNDRSRVVVGAGHPHGEPEPAPAAASRRTLGR
ncbi:type II toxin-antitoxin system Rv0910 family toxin [Mycobacterium avium]|uniref:type II toxin-antitoxin system Rv0910 family toxin n=1 Tax=Mycobacterium avium TaxID=1764 RepID=UPI000AB1A170|nr:SRPBCC family protein [Mycobacterium avium]